jgi:hypothetical protein
LIEVVEGGSQDEQGGAVGILHEADARLIVYAVNHIEQAESDLREAMRLLADVDIIEGIIDNRLRRSVLAFLAAHQQEGEDA